MLLAPCPGANTPVDVVAGWEPNGLVPADVPVAPAVKENSEEEVVVAAEGLKVNADVLLVVAEPNTVLVEVWAPKMFEAAVEAAEPKTLCAVAVVTVPKLDGTAVVLAPKLKPWLATEAEIEMLMFTLTLSDCPSQNDTIITTSLYL